MKKILILTRDIEDWSFEFMNREDVVRKVKRSRNQVTFAFGEELEVTLLNSWWRDSLRGYKWNIVVLDMDMELRDWEQFMTCAVDGYRFGEKANYLRNGRRVAAIFGGSNKDSVDKKDYNRYISFK